MNKNPYGFQLGQWAILNTPYFTQHCVILIVKKIIIYLLEFNFMQY